MAIYPNIPIGEIIAGFVDYDIDPEPIGHGGTKSAYRILGEESRALKIVREPLPTEPIDGNFSIPERIKRETEAMRRVDHEGVVKILDGPHTTTIGGEQRVWYIEPYYGGGTLADKLVTPWSEQACTALLVCLARAAEALAEQRIVHRDIKPTNIVFDDQGDPILLDLDIAYFRDLSRITGSLESSPLTEAYAAPEQFERRPNPPIDYRTDMFLIGMVAFEAATCHHPFNLGDMAGYYDRLMTGEWERQLLLGRNFSDDFAGVIDRLLQPDVNRRYRQFSHLYAAIGAQT